MQFDHLNILFKQLNQKTFPENWDSKASFVGAFLAYLETTTISFQGIKPFLFFKHQFGKEFRETSLDLNLAGEKLGKTFCSFLGRIEGKKLIL